jgi:tetratricopeptide (TPR) repeat protein
MLFADANFAASLGDRGLEHIRKAVESDPTAGFPHAMLGSRLQEQGDFEEAAKSIQTSIELQPNQGFAYYLFAHNRKVKEDDRQFWYRVEETSNQSDLITEERQYLHFALGKAFDDLSEYEKAMHHFDLAHDRGEGADTGARATEVQVKRMNRFKEIFTEEFLNRYADLGLETDAPIFIVGMPRSGTTLLEQIVSRHSTVGGAGELFFWRDHCRRIINLREGAINPRQAALAANKYLDFIRSRAPGKAHVTDKFPSNYAYLGLLRLIYPNARFIHAKRNPIDTSLSIYMRPFVSNQGLGRNRRQIVDTYKAYRQSMQVWRELIEPSRLIEVDYEELVQNPEPMIRKIVQFCGLEWEDACLSPQEGDRRVLTFSMWQVRQPVYTSSVERWRRYEPWLGIFRELEDLAPA